MISTLLADVDLRKEFLLNPKTGATVSNTFGSPASLINALLPNLFVFAGLILFIYLSFGGITILASSGDPKATEKGTQAIKTALVGFLLIFGAYWIVQIVQIFFFGASGLDIFNTKM